MAISNSMIYLAVKHCDTLSLDILIIASVDTNSTCDINIRIDPINVVFDFLADMVESNQC